MLLPKFIRLSSAWNPLGGLKRWSGFRKLSSLMSAKWWQARPWIYLWIPAVVIVSALVAGLLLPSRGSFGFLGNVIAEIIGIAAALSITWFFVQRHYDKEREITRKGIRDQLQLVRDVCCRAITQTALHVSKGDFEVGGAGYVKQNYDHLRKLLEREDGLPVLSKHERDPEHIYHLFRGFHPCTESLDRAVRFYGAGLIEFPFLLKSFDAFDGLMKAEGERWEQFRLAHASHEAALSEYRMSVARGNPYPPGWEVPDLPPAPYEAVHNLLEIAAACLGIATACALVTRDWGDLPPLRHTKFIWDWTYSRVEKRPHWAPQEPNG